jgi:Phosphotransferase enzyme family
MPRHQAYQWERRSGRSALGSAHARSGPASSELGGLFCCSFRVALAPRPGLELRTRALYDVDFAGWRKSAGTSQLLAMAEERIARLRVPDRELVFVHGDLWLGNTIWSGDSCSGMIDWDAAGAGSPGIDLGTLRLDVALFFGSSASSVVWVTQGGG